MEEESRVLTLSELVAVLVAETQSGNAAQAVAILESLVSEEGEHFAADELLTLARIETYCDAAVDTGPLRAAVQQELEARGLWRRFRRAERRRVWLAFAKWIAQLLLLSVAVLAAVFGLVIALKWVLYWMGF